ncbi:hypothetical protein ACJX0J_025180 [Zea mays]
MAHFRLGIDLRHVIIQLHLWHLGLEEKKIKTVIPYLSLGTMFHLQMTNIGEHISSIVFSIGKLFMVNHVFTNTRKNLHRGKINRTEVVLTPPNGVEICCELLNLLFTTLLSLLERGWWMEFKLEILDMLALTSIHSWIFTEISSTAPAKYPFSFEEDVLYCEFYVGVIDTTPTIHFHGILTLESERKILLVASHARAQILFFHFLQNKFVYMYTVYFNVDMICPLYYILLGT